MAAQKLFSDFPNVSGIPGMLTPNMTADVRQTANIQDQAAAYALQQRMKADRKSEWARAAAANSSRRSPGPSAEDERIKLRRAFNELYADPIRRQSHDAAFKEPSIRGENLRRQYGHVGTYPGGFWASGTGFNTGKVPYKGKGENYVNATLDQMWRMKTDPYLRAAQAMSPWGGSK